MRCGLEIAVALRHLHEAAWNVAGYQRLLGNDAVHRALLAGQDAPTIEALYEADLRRFAGRRAPHLLYP